MAQSVAGIVTGKSKLGNIKNSIDNVKSILIDLLKSQGYSVITINLTPKGEQNDNHNIGTSEVKEIINCPHHESNRLVKSKGQASHSRA